MKLTTPCTSIECHHKTHGVVWKNSEQDPPRLLRALPDNYTAIFSVSCLELVCVSPKLMLIQYTVELPLSRNGHLPLPGSNLNNLVQQIGLHNSPGSPLCLCKLHFLIVLEDMGWVTTVCYMFFPLKYLYDAYCVEYISSYYTPCYGQYPSYLALVPFCLDKGGSTVLCNMCKCIETAAERMTEVHLYISRFTDWDNVTPQHEYSLQFPHTR